MRWGAQITDTAKVSVEVRYIWIKNVDASLWSLYDLRRRANKCLSLETVAAFAASVQLPTPSPEEESELRDPDVPILVASSTVGISEEDNVEDLEDASRNTKDSMGAPLSSMVDDSYQTQDEELDPSFWFDQEAPTRAPSPETEDEASSSATSQSDVDKPDPPRSNQDNALMTPCNKSFPTQLRALVEQVEHDKKMINWLDRLPAAVIDANAAQYPCRSAWAKYAERRRAPTDLVTAAHLLQLHEHIQDLTRFRSYLRTSVKDVSDALNRREDRYVMRETNGDITSFMKSRGLGSPLVESISADEKWPDEEDTWGMPPVKTPRRKIYGCKALKKGSATEDGWTSLNGGKRVSETKRKTRKVKW